MKLATVRAPEVTARRSERPRRRRIQIRLADRRAGGHQYHALDREQGQPTAVERCRPLGAITYERARHAATTHTHDSVGSHVNDLPSVLDMEVIRSPRLKVGVDPLGGASIGILGADCRTLRHRHRGGERYGGSHVWLQVAGLGRQGSHGRLIAVHQGTARRPRGPLGHRFWQRPRRRPPQHRDAGRRPDEPPMARAAGQRSTPGADGRGTSLPHSRPSIIGRNAIARLPSTG